VMRETRRPTLIVSVQRALHLLEALAAHSGGAPAKQLARESGLPIGTTYHLLRTLVHEGYVSKLDDGVFVLGDRLESINARGRKQALLSRVRPALVALRDEIGAAAYLAMYDAGEIEVIDIADGPRQPRVDLWVGFDRAAHATALGKCVLTQLEPAARSDYLSRHPPADLTPHTITDQHALLRLLARPSAVAFDHQEYAIGTSCAAVPVSTGVAVGALAVSCRPQRLAEVKASAHRLRAAAERISRTLALTFTR
jgi:IclR family transcriptional regulator, acetate operon repressor